MSVTAANPRGRRLFRWTAFRAGLAVGAAAVVGLAVLIAIWLAPALEAPWYTADVSAIGSDVSRHGGDQVFVRNDDGRTFSQRCNGTCDDVRVRIRTGDAGLRVDVMDEAGACVACDDSGSYVAHGLATAWTVAGQQKLRVRNDLVSRQRD